MKSTPKVSVMVVAYNQAQLIRETLDSILAQDYDNLEIVVADDASTDGTSDILKEYATRYPDKFVLVLNERNQGITGNCNAALAACTGELVATFSGDDLFLPGKIRAQVEQFVQDPEVVLCYHPVEIFDSASNKTMYVTFQNPREVIRDFADIITGGGILGACSVMVRRSACPPGGFDARLPAVSDWLFHIEVAFNGKITNLNRVYGRYRKHARGASNRTFELLDETLYALDLAIQKHPDRPGLAELCRQGKARYLAGEVFRQMGKDVRIARDLAQRAVALNPENFKYRAMLGLCQISAVAQLAGLLLNRAKYLIKRYL